MPAAVTPTCAGAAPALPAAPTVVAASVIISINWRRLILPCSNSLSFVAAKPYMAVLPSSDKRIFAVDRGDLHLISIGIVDVHAAFAARRIGARRFQRIVDARVVPIRHRVADVVDHSPGRLFVVAEVARYDEGAAFARFRTAKLKIGATHALIVVDLGVEHLGVPIACNAVIRARIGDVIDREHLQPARRSGLRRTAGGKDSGGQSHRLAKLSAVYLPALKASDEISDETFHAVILPD